MLFRIHFFYILDQMSSKHEFSTISVAPGTASFFVIPPNYCQVLLTVAAVEHVAGTL